MVFLIFAQQFVGDLFNPPKKFVHDSSIITKTPGLFNPGALKKITINLLAYYNYMERAGYLWRPGSGVFGGGCRRWSHFSCWQVYFMRNRIYANGAGTRLGRYVFNQFKLVCINLAYHRNRAFPV